MKANSDSIIKELDGNLCLRPVSPADGDAVAKFNAGVFTLPEEKHNPYIYAWTHDLATRPHPTLKPEDILIVESRDTGAIVSSMNLINQTWTFDGIPFGVGRPELVATAHDYRNRGLVREQFAVVHEWSTERGHLMQAITGIPWYYRIFGYEMAVNLEGGRSLPLTQVPKAKEGEEEHFMLRPATQADLSFIQTTYEQGCRRYPLACQREEPLWVYEFSGKSEHNCSRSDMLILEDKDSRAVGFLLLQPDFHRDLPLTIRWFEIISGVSWVEVMPSVTQALKSMAEDRIRQKEDDPPRALRFELGEEHPSFSALHENHMLHRPYAWYIRIPDMPAFLTHVSPALDKRMAKSIAAGHTGELKISFYRSGLRLVWNRGVLETVESWKPTVEDGGNAQFPDKTFIQLLLGYRSLDELKHAFPDCSADAPAGGLLQALFPKQSSNILPVS